MSIVLFPLTRQPIRRSLSLTERLAPLDGITSNVMACKVLLAVLLIS